MCDTPNAPMERLNPRSSRAPTDSPTATRRQGHPPERAMYATTQAQSARPDRASARHPRLWAGASVVFEWASLSPPPHGIPLPNVGENASRCGSCSWESEPRARYLALAVIGVRQLHTRTNRNRVPKPSSSYRNPMVKHEPELHKTAQTAHRQRCCTCCCTRVFGS